MPLVWLYMIVITIKDIYVTFIFTKVFYELRRKNVKKMNF